MKTLLITFFVTLASLASGTATERVLTSTSGQATLFRLVDKTENGIVAIRSSDSQRFTIALDSLSTADRTFLATWTPEPPASREMRGSSVSLAGKPTLTRTSYASKYQPRSGGGGGGHCVTTWTKSCTGQRVVTITGGGGCGRPPIPVRSAPAPAPRVQPSVPPARVALMPARR